MKREVFNSLCRDSSFPEEHASPSAEAGDVFFTEKKNLAQRHRRRQRGLDLRVRRDEKTKSVFPRAPAW